MQIINLMWGVIILTQNTYSFYTCLMRCEVDDLIINGNLYFYHYKKKLNIEIR